jgi:DNA-binding transcriptional ArsR family regulator
MDLFAALAEPTRRKIIEILARQGQLPASEIYEHFDVTPQAISPHHKIRREADLVHVEKDAQKRLYSINPTAVGELEAWAHRTRQMWIDRFDRLERLLDEQTSADQM